MNKVLTCIAIKRPVESSVTGYRDMLKKDKVFNGRGAIQAPLLQALSYESSSSSSIELDFFPTKARLSGLTAYFYMPHTVLTLDLIVCLSVSSHVVVFTPAF
ncbi:hypothetical protein ILYODFUR_035552 [Ilyodon furcidens]|uniref:Uncharacterized protein n=1 Tax=Ilyodon furcidens TaxID=33524 RepID=A0ABV0VMG4_9TELE